MTKSKKNAERENRIEMKIIVDAYGLEEQAMGWYYYLEEKLSSTGITGLTRDICCRWLRDSYVVCDISYQFILWVLSELLSML